MTIVRMGMSERKGYGEGWEAIFRKGKSAKPAKASGSSRKKAKAGRKKK